jgi:hypothetical protein
VIKIELLNKMIEDGFDEFEKDKDRHKNLKAFVKFGASAYEYDEKKILMSEPKLKKQVKASVYIKTTNKNQLF